MGQRQGHPPGIKQTKWGRDRVSDCHPPGIRQRQDGVETGSPTWHQAETKWGRERQGHPPGIEQRQNGVEIGPTAVVPLTDHALGIAEQVRNFFLHQ